MKLLQLLFTTAILSTEALVDPYNNSNDGLFPVVIATILKRYFWHPHEAILIIRKCNGSTSNQQQLDLLNEVIHQINGELVIRFYHEPHKDLARPRFFNLFIVDGYGSFREIYDTMDYTKFEFSGYYLVVIGGEVLDELNDLILCILEDLWRLDIFNVNVLVNGLDNDISVYTFFPYSETHCAEVKPLLWHKFTGIESGLGRIDLYPERLKSFHGCPLVGGTLEAKPYTIMHWHRYNQGVSVSGFEGDLIDLLAAKQNFTVRYEVSPAAWGFAKKLGESTGLMKMIQEEQVDFGVGCMAFAYDRSYWLKPGIAHYTSKVLFAVPAGRPFTAFEKLFRPFKASIWYYITLYLTTGAFVTCILQRNSQGVRSFVYGPGNSSPYLNMMNIFFGGALPIPPKRNFARTLLLLWIYFCFVIRTLYQGSLYLYLQRTMNHKPLESMTDIHRSGIQYYMMEIGQRYFITMPHVLERTTYITPGKDALGNMVEKIGAGLVDGVVLIPQDHAAYHNKIFPKSQFVQIAKEHVAVYPVGIYYPKKSRLTKVFDDQIRNVQATGLIDFWIRRYGDYDFFIKQTGSTEPRKLNNHHLVGGYQVFVCWLVISGIVFLLELLSMRLAFLRRFLLFIMD